jgi:uncharacterized protein
MAGKFELKINKNGKYYFNLKAENGRIILYSEMYETKGAALDGIVAVKMNAPYENNYLRKISATGVPYFILVAKNGQELGRSETIESLNSMENQIDSVKHGVIEANINVAV